MKVFVFDLDFTLWDAGGLWCDCTTPPYKRCGNYITDANGARIVLYPNVESFLKKLKSLDIKLAIASRTSAPHIAIELLELFEIRHLFDYEEIFPAQKTTHLKNIQKKSGTDFGEMVFFDDEYRNIMDVLTLGVCCELVDGGLDTRLAEEKYL